MSQILEFADRLRSQIDVVQVVEQYVPLRKAGTNLKGLCPFHKEKTPSFSVSPAKQIFHCFGCGAGGDVIRFVQKVERLEWIEAVRLLAEKYRIPMPEWKSGGAGASQESRDARERQLAVCRLAAEFFAKHLASMLSSGGSEAEVYLQRRQLDRDIVERFGLGLSPEGWSGFLEHAARAGFDREFLAGAGLVIHNRDANRFYDRFRGRLMFPIWDGSGRPVAFGGRVFAASASPEEPKYINSPETALYQKSQHLYGLHLARESMIERGEALLMEGYLDVIRAHQHGFTNAVASCGTALTDEQARIIRKYCTRVVFAYDGDDAGRKAMLRGCEVLLAHDFSIRVVALPPEHDPDSFLRDLGAEAFDAQLEQASDFFDFFLQCAGQAHDRRSVDGRVQIVESVTPLLKRMGNAIARQDAVKRVADFLSLEERLIERQLRDKQGREPARLREELAQRTVEDPRCELLLLKMAVESPRARGKILNQVEVEWFESTRVRGWFEQLRGMDVTEPLTWDGLISMCEQDEEASFLSRLAVDEEVLSDNEEAILHSISRIHFRARKRVSADLARRVEAFYRPDHVPDECLDAIRELDANARPAAELGRRVFIRPASPSQEPH